MGITISFIVFVITYYYLGWEYVVAEIIGVLLGLLISKGSFNGAPPLDPDIDIDF